MSNLKDRIAARLAFEVELGGPLVPTETTAAATTEKESMPTTNGSAALDAPERAEPSPSAVEERSHAGAPNAPPADVYRRIDALVPSYSPLGKMDTLAQVEEYVAATVLIPLDETRLNPVFGVGNPNADVMVIGEAPGADEDRQGEPFVGRAGQLLNKILQAIGFARSDVYIANILKSRPPNNRNPSPLEVEGHLPVLLKQIALIKPKLILCTGKVAAATLLETNTSLGKMRGRFHDFHGIPLLVTYHPAALLRNPEWKRPTWEDVQMLRARYDEMTAPPQTGEQ